MTALARRGGVAERRAQHCFWKPSVAYFTLFLRQQTATDISSSRTKYSLELLMTIVINHRFISIFRSSTIIAAHSTRSIPRTRSSALPRCVDGRRGGGGRASAPPGGKERDRTGDGGDGAAAGGRGGCGRLLPPPPSLPAFPSSILPRRLRRERSPAPCRRKWDGARTLDRPIVPNSIPSVCEVDQIKGEERRPNTASSTSRCRDARVTRLRKNFAIS